MTTATLQLGRIDLHHHLLLTAALDVLCGYSKVICLNCVDYIVYASYIYDAACIESDLHSFDEYKPFGEGQQRRGALVVCLWGWLLGET